MSTAKKVYLAGPMSGYKDFNFPAFAQATEALRALGFEVFSPAEEDLRKWGDLEGVKKYATYRECLRVDLLYILDHAEAIALMPGWEDSKGARIEAALADALDLEFLVLKNNEGEADAVDVDGSEERVAGRQGGYAPQAAEAGDSPFPSLSGR